MHWRKLKAKYYFSRAKTSPALTFDLLFGESALLQGFILLARPVRASSAGELSFRLDQFRRGSRESARKSPTTENGRYQKKREAEELLQQHRRKLKPEEELRLKEN